MQEYKLKEFKRGWICGQFYPSLLRSDIEVGIQQYKAGDKHESHLHKETTEINVITSGSCRFNKLEWTNNYTCLTDSIVLNEGDILIIEKSEMTQFVALTDCTLVVIKDKSIPSDKFTLEEMIQS